jgi:predicted small lipoprotein YifL
MNGERCTIASMRNAILLLVLAAVSAGCGHRGPLYLPKPKPDAHQPAPPPAPDEKKPGA